MSLLEWSDPDRRDDALMRCLLRVVVQPEPRDTLTERELRALECMSRGLERTGTAAVLGVSTDRVAGMLTVARRVLRAKNTTHACCEALRQGLIT